MTRPVRENVATYDGLWSSGSKCGAYSRRHRNQDTRHYRRCGLSFAVTGLCLLTLCLNRRNGDVRSCTYMFLYLSYLEQMDAVRSSTEIRVEPNFPIQQTVEKQPTSHFQAHTDTRNRLGGFPWSNGSNLNSSSGLFDGDCNLELPGTAHNFWTGISITNNTPILCYLWPRILLLNHCCRVKWLLQWILWQRSDSDSLKLDSVPSLQEINHHYDHASLSNSWLLFSFPASAILPSVTGHIGQNTGNSGNMLVSIHSSADLWGSDLRRYFQFLVYGTFLVCQPCPISLRWRAEAHSTSYSSPDRLR